MEGIERGRNFCDGRLWRVACDWLHPANISTLRVARKEEAAAAPVPDDLGGLV